MAAAAREAGGTRAVVVLRGRRANRVLRRGPPQGPLAAGVYRLRFDTGAYFLARGMRSFHPEVVVTFLLDDASSCHVPLLLSPFGYSTYRGS